MYMLLPLTQTYSYVGHDVLEHVLLDRFDLWSGMVMCMTLVYQMCCLGPHTGMVSYRDLHPDRCLTLCQATW